MTRDRGTGWPCIGGGGASGLANMQSTADGMQMTQSAASAARRGLCAVAGWHLASAPIRRRQKPAGPGFLSSPRSSRLWRREGVRKEKQRGENRRGRGQRMGFHLLQCVLASSAEPDATRWSLQRETEREEGRKGTVVICFPFFSLSLGLDGCRCLFVTPLCPHPFLGCTVSAVKVKNLSK